MSDDYPDAIDIRRVAITILTDDCEGWACQWCGAVPYEPYKAFRERQEREEEMGNVCMALNYFPMMGDSITVHFYIAFHRNDPIPPHKTFGFRDVKTMPTMHFFRRAPACSPECAKKYFAKCEVVRRLGAEDRP